MTAKFARCWAKASRANLAGAVGFLALSASHSASAALASREQRRAFTPDVYRLCPGEIPNVRAITNCLRRQKASLRPAGRCSISER